jgi:hypothetical protein
MCSLSEEIHCKVDLSPIGCAEHSGEVKRLLILYFNRVSIYHRCRLLNRKLARSLRNRQTVTNIPASKPVDSSDIVLNQTDTSQHVELNDSVDDPTVFEEYTTGVGGNQNHMSYIPDDTDSLFGIDDFAALDWEAVDTVERELTFSQL